MSIKLKTLLITTLYIFTSFLIGCTKDDVEEIIEDVIAVSGISLNQTSADLKVGETVDLIATLAPEGIEAVVEWSTSDASIATVTEGVVTAVAKGSATVVASHGAFSATCNVVVTEEVKEEEEPDNGVDVPDNLHSSLQGSDYFIVTLDETSFSYIQDKVTADLRPDQASKNFYLWNGFEAGTPSGNNFYGSEEGWTSLIVNADDWSGAGFHIGVGYGEVDLTAFNSAPEEYVFHAAFKSSDANSVYTLLFHDGISEVRVVIGATAHEGVEPYTDFARDGEWHSVEIPITHLNEIGLTFEEPSLDKNILGVLAGNVIGTTLDMDAAFFYKKAN